MLNRPAKHQPTRIAPLSAPNASNSVRTRRTHPALAVLAITKVPMPRSPSIAAANSL
jgi:hypothetical protein